MVPHAREVTEDQLQISRQSYQGWIDIAVKAANFIALMLPQPSGATIHGYFIAGFFSQGLYTGIDWGEYLTK
jgi:hypothetical protein